MRDIQHKCKKPLTAKNPFKKGTSMSNAPTPSLTLEDIRTVSPALERYTQGALLGDVWKRPGLAPRDRSVITLAALIARNQTVEMGHHVNLALDNGVKPGESRRSSRTSRSTAAGRMPCRRWRLRKTSSSSAASAPINSPRLRTNSFPLTRQRRLNARLPSSNWSDRRFQGS